MSQKEANSDLTRCGELLLEALFDRAPGEPMVRTFERAGVSRAQGNRLLRDPQFVAAVEERTKRECAGHHPAIMGAFWTRCEAGDPQALRLYFQRRGELRERIEHSGPDGNPIRSEVQARIESATYPIRDLPAEVKRELLAELQGDPGIIGFD